MSLTRFQLVGASLVAFTVCVAYPCRGGEASVEDAVLAAWEQRSNGVKMVDCEFTRWEYRPMIDGVHPDGQPFSGAISRGKMRFREQGQWEFKVEEVRRRDRATGRFPQVQRGNEHWVFDGRDYWELNAAKKTIQHIPGDSAFLGITMDAMFAPIWLSLAGGKADAIRRDYHVKVVTARQYAHGEVWIQLVPRTAKLRATFSNLTVILQRPDMHTRAVQMTGANGTDMTTIEFQRTKLNDVFAPPIKAPKPPPGWEVVLAGGTAEKRESAPSQVEKSPVENSAATAQRPTAANPPGKHAPRRHRLRALWRRGS